MARLAWASCVVVLAVSCGGSDYTPFFGGEGGANGTAGNASGNSGGGQPGSGGSSNSGGSSAVGTGGSGMNGAGGTTGTGGTTGSGGMTGGGGKGTGGAGGSSGGGAGSNGTPDSGAAGAGGMAGSPDAGMNGRCLSNVSCPDTSYCKKTSCAADVAGTCTPKPTACEDDAVETPVCGCNGVTYFSSCLAEWSGENVVLHSICGDGVAVRCTNANPACVNFPNGFCGYLATSATGCPNGGTFPPAGRCWVLPENCPTYANRFNGCNGITKCAGTCEAVKAERSFYRQPLCN